MIDEFEQICIEISAIHSNLTSEKAERILKVIFSAERVFMAGEGRSGLMIQAFANRLTQAGLDVHVVTEITAPAISPGDLLIFNSASGTSAILNSQAKSAKKVGAQIITFTANANASLSQKSDEVIIIDAQSKDEVKDSIQPMASLYEQESLIIFDSLMLKALRAGLITNKQLRSLHSNLE